MELRHDCVIYVSCQGTSEIRCDYSSNCSDAVGDGHQGSGEVRRKVQSVHFHTAVEGTHETHSYSEIGHRQHSVAAGVGRHYYENSGTQRSCRREVLREKCRELSKRTDCSEEFSSESDTGVLLFDQPVTNPTARHRHYPHDGVR
jgi:hypothetical protein